MLATIRDDTWNVLNMQHLLPNWKKDGIIQTSPVVAINRLKNLSTWLKVATTLEKPPTPNHNDTSSHGVDMKLWQTEKDCYRAGCYSWKYGSHIGI